MMAATSFRAGPAAGDDRPLVVKFVMARPRHYNAQVWLRHFPGFEPAWGRCRFVFDADAREYDWLVAYDDMPPDRDDGSKQGAELLACSPRHTLLLTVEPSSIKTYGSRFTAQFGLVLTSQEPWALPHAHAIRSHPALQWFYGWGQPQLRGFDEIRDHPPLAKSRLISTVASPKRQRHTLHRRRHLFTGELKALLPELDVFGRGLRPMNDKAEALDDYRYHVALENFRGPHHWTEKLADSFLGCTLPFYHGCPNASDYFPEGSFIPIDISDPAGAARVIRAAIDGGEYEKRLPLILEARRRVLHQYNMFAVLSRIIESHHTGESPVPGARLLSRHAVRSASAANAILDAWEKIRGRWSAFRAAT
jgi:hypothetical protein